MPRKAARPCAKMGCPNLVKDSSRRYCPEHQAEEWRRESRKRRKKGTHADYGQEWREISKQFLENNPICQRCGYPSEVAHHVRPGDNSSLVALCRSCHSKIHAEAGDYF